jgi:hypothetical protein
MVSDYQIARCSAQTLAGKHIQHEGHSEKKE